MSIFKKTTDQAAPATTDEVKPVTPVEGAEKPAKTKKEKAPKEPKEAKAPVAPKTYTAEDLTAAQATWDALKAEAAALNPVPVELKKKITKARRTARNIRKALGSFIPVKDRPKKVKPVKEPKASKADPVPASAEEAQAPA